jgi:hypothetical protein
MTRAHSNSKRFPYQRLFQPGAAFFETAERQAIRTVFGFRQEKQSDRSTNGRTGKSIA